MTEATERETVIRTWAARRRTIERAQYAVSALFLVIVLGAGFLLPASLADDGVAARVILILVLAAGYLTVLVRYCRCPKCDQHPGPKTPRIHARTAVRQSARFDMENWESCAKCGVALR